MGEKKKEVQNSRRSASRSSHFKQAGVPGRLEAALWMKGRPIQAEDGMIAARALHPRPPLVAGHIRRFARIQGLETVEWGGFPPNG